MNRFLLTVCLVFLAQQGLGEDRCSRVADKTRFFNFTNSCFRHDFCYSESELSSRTRKTCDVHFRKDTFSTCNRRNYICKTTSFIYYQGVRFFGGGGWEKLRREGRKYVSKIDQLGSRQFREVASILNDRFDLQEDWIAKKHTCGRLKRKSQKIFMRRKTRKKIKEQYSKCKSELRAMNVADYPPILAPKYGGNNWNR